ncbi:hypothetical protein GUJ93_ZPchr0009g1211 [Zizania palustris]|uniref:Uncharacterized protein n=1 Tax=Zizania palustris TaxID=103762 RepID=A0A8J5V4Y3_ZIZPA|nr:hypothetical protein GUJ93_ZPchr0009g1211 [Zizania palustris]
MSRACVLQAAAACHRSEDEAHSTQEKKIAAAPVGSFAAAFSSVQREPALGVVPREATTSTEKPIGSPVKIVHMNQAANFFHGGTRFEASRAVALRGCAKRQAFFSRFDFARQAHGSQDHGHQKCSVRLVKAAEAPAFYLSSAAARVGPSGALFPSTRKLFIL